MKILSGLQTYYNEEDEDVGKIKEANEDDEEDEEEDENLIEVIKR